MTWLQRFHESSKREDIELTLANMISDGLRKKEKELKKQSKEQLNDNEQPKMRLKKALVQKMKTAKMPIPDFLKKENEIDFKKKIKSLFSKWRSPIFLMDPNNKFQRKLNEVIKEFEDSYPEEAGCLVNTDCLHGIYMELVYEYVKSMVFWDFFQNIIK